MRRRGVRRRGIILLMSLSLLTLFLMMLVTLIVITGQYRQSARVQARQDRVGDPPHKMADLAMKAILVGDGTGASAATGHELFRDLYGDSWRGVVTRVYMNDPVNEPLYDDDNAGSTSTYLTFEFRRVDDAGAFVDLSSTVPGEHVGCILTFVDGAATTPKNVSVRILEYVPPWRQQTPAPATPKDPQIGRFTIARTTPEDSMGLFDRATQGDAIAVGDEFVVNERPFSGYGAGYGLNVPGDATQGYGISKLDAIQYVYQTTPSVPSPSTPSHHPIPLALAPNYRTYDANVGAGAVGNAASVEYGGFNEDYDAVDYQNMFLAYVPTNATRADQIVPSFWRPELVNFWRHYLFDHDGDMTADASLWYQETTPGTRVATDPVAIRRRNAFYRTIFLRPLPTDHPEFTGSNPDFALPNDPAAPNDPARRLMMPLSLLTGINDINEDGTADETAGDPLFWPPMPDTRSSPPAFDPVQDVNANNIADQWDVDNDNDGITDSIWIDVGLPVQRMEDGKLYKPLVAFLIRDLDGLANVNAHLHSDFGNGAQSDLATLNPPLAGVTTGQKIRPRGLGYGPAEIAVPGTGFGTSGTEPLFFSTAALPQAQRLLAVRYGVLNDGRPGRPNVNDLPSILRNPTLRQSVYRADVSSEWGTPPDAWGTQAIGLDYLGQPWNDHVGGINLTPPQLSTHLTPGTAHPNGPTEGGDDPYEIDLYSAHSGGVDPTLQTWTPDAPYTLAELERVLRWTDPDVSQLPYRLVSSANPTNDPASAFNDFRRRRAVTTTSSHIPTMPSAVPSEDRGAGREKWSLYHLMFERIIQNARIATGAPFDGPTVPTNAAHVQWVDDQIRKMMPWEMWSGMKFDVNRRWQNGFDDDGDGVVDEPDEVTTPETVFPNYAGYGLAPLATYNQNFDHLGADPQLTAFGAPNRFARQIYARHLYSLLLFLMDYDPSGSDPTLGFSPDLVFDDGDYDPNLSPQQKDELFKRRLAQWAINVVDYRDPDVICTPFEYDVNPFNGWQAEIDGDPQSVNLPAGWAPENNERRIVWGVEAPHLLLTETLALHDRRVIDSDTEDTGGMAVAQTRQQGDTDLDQHRTPQGSLFLELLAVGNRAANDAQLPVELYNRTSGELDLSRVASGSPVWRVAISAPHGENDLTKSAYARRRQIAQHATGTGGSEQPPTSFDPNDLNLLSLSHPTQTWAGVMPQQVPLDRYVVFSSTMPTVAGMGAANTFNYRQGMTSVAPGSYVVVAPRPKTKLSLLDDEDVSSTPPRMQGPGTERVPSLEVKLPSDPAPTLPNLPLIDWQFSAFDNFQGPAVPAIFEHPDGTGRAKIYQPNFASRAIICGADAPAGGWPEVAPGAGMSYIGMNVTEPMPSSGYYYTMPTDDPDGDGIIDGYAEGDGTEDTLPDEPFDSQILDPMDPNYAAQLDQRPLYKWGATATPNDGLETKTIRNWRTAFLQRLANPLEAFDATRNPYITVDFAPIDVSVYNGDDRKPPSFMGSDWDPDDPESEDPAQDFPEMRFMSRERGRDRDRRPDEHETYNRPNVTVGNLDDRHFLLWEHSFPDPVSTESTAAAALGMSADLRFRHNLLHTLGYLNVTMGMGADPPLTGYVEPGNSNYLGAPGLANGAHRSFPWLNWADRPFATPYELLSVPFSSQTTWFEDWSRDRSSPTVQNNEPYKDANADPYAFTAYDNSSFKGLYNHLLNFFHGAQGARPPGGDSDSPRMYRLFEYLETPSPYSGSREIFDSNFTGPNGMLAPGYLRYGTNYLSRFRDPGRVNLNTMPPQVWDAFSYAHQASLPNGAPYDATTFHQTRGIPSGAQTWRYPTRIPKPFRDANKADLAPMLPGQGPYLPDRLRQYGIEGTLLRSDAVDPSATAPFEPVFAGRRDNDDANDDTNDQFQNTDKNPAFRYEQLSRLPNLTTNQSNVYAVWLTVGYFEAYRESPTTRLPTAAAALYAGQPLADGVWLGPEIGADTGRSRRHRAFYILDRSIPVAFEPGQDHNFEKAILLRRYLD